jgi:hypothetical protein
MTVMVIVKVNVVPAMCLALPMALHMSDNLILVCRYMRESISQTRTLMPVMLSDLPQITWCRRSWLQVAWLPELSFLRLFCPPTIETGILIWREMENFKLVLCAHALNPHNLRGFYLIYFFF